MQLDDTLGSPHARAERPRRFSDLTDLSPRLPRKLDERWLLSPVHVDPETRCGFCDHTQIEQARADDEYPLMSRFNAGALAASASDFRVTIPPDPIGGIEAGVMRSAPGWDVAESDILWPEERGSVRRT